GNAPGDRLAPASFCGRTTRPGGGRRNGLARPSASSNGAVLFLTGERQPMGFLPDWVVNKVGVHTGPGIEALPEVTRIKNAMRTLGVPIECYIEKIVEVDSLPNPACIRFLNKDPNAMLRQVQALAMRCRCLVHDDKSTLQGLV